MNPKKLKQMINSRFSSSREFIKEFNQVAEFLALDETTLSRQLSGRVNLSKAWKAAYTLFFKQQSK